MIPPCSIPNYINTHLLPNNKREMHRNLSKSSALPDVAKQVLLCPQVGDYQLMHLHLDGHLGALPSGSNLGMIRGKWQYNTFDAMKQ